MRKLAIPLFLLCILNAAGQPLDSTGKKSTKGGDSTVNLYFTSVGETSAIHNGRIFYDGTWYHDLSMLYDIYIEQSIL